MILYTGTIKDKQYSREVVAIDVLAKHLGVSLPKVANFRLLSGEKKWDPVNKRFRFPKIRKYPTRIVGNYKGEQVEVIYATAMPIEDKDKNIKYTPSKVTYKGDEMQLTEVNKEEMLFLHLMPWNKNSPIRNKNSRAEFESFSKEQESKKNLAKETDHYRIAATILGESNEAKLRVFAKGLRLAGEKNQIYTVGNVDKLTIDEIKIKLIQIAKVLPNQLMSAYSDTLVLTKGTINDAIDRGLIVLVNGAMGNKIWRFSEDLGGEEIVKVGKSQNEKQVLYLFVTDVSNYNFVFSKLNKIFGDDVISSNLSKLKELVESTEEKPVEEMNVSELVDYLVDSGSIDIDRTTKSIFQINDDGQYAEQALTSILDLKGWKTELIAWGEKSKTNFNKLKKIAE